VTRTLGELVDLSVGCAFKSTGFTDEADGIRLLRGDNVGQGRLRWESCKRWPASGLQGLDRYFLVEGDVILAMDRPWIGGGLKQATVRSEDLPALLVQRVARLRARRGLDQGFLAAVVASQEFEAHILSVITGSAVPHISGSQILSFPLRRLPAESEQRRIAATLGALDEKITSNRRTDEWCLALAVESYRAACREASQRLALGDAGKWLSGGTPSTEDPSLWNGDFPWISAASLKSLHVASSDRRLTSAGLQRATNVVPAGTVLLVVRGMSLKSELRMGVAQRPVAFGQDVKAIIPTVVPSALLAAALYSARSDILELVDEAGHGTGRLQWDLLSAFPIAIPEDARLVPLLDALLARGAAAARESRKLAALRDALLPELLSGRIRVPEAGEAFESALS
jgi:type I restriction enzyme S subunit